jgi:hypothetical protein
MFVTDVTKWEEVARVHGEVFGEIRPATSIVQVPRLIDDAAQIEIEADAVVVERIGRPCVPRLCQPCSLAHQTPDYRRY